MNPRQFNAGGGTRADFKKFDADRNGELDADELEQLAEHDAKRTAEAYRQSLTKKLHQVGTLKHCTLIIRLTLLLSPARKRGKLSWKTENWRPRDDGDRTATAWRWVWVCRRGSRPFVSAAIRRPFHVRSRRWCAASDSVRFVTSCGGV